MPRLGDTRDQFIRDRKREMIEQQSFLAERNKTYAERNQRKGKFRHYRVSKTSGVYNLAPPIQVSGQLHAGSIPKRTKKRTPTAPRARVPNVIAVSSHIIITVVMLFIATRMAQAADPVLVYLSSFFVWLSLMFTLMATFMGAYEVVAGMFWLVVAVALLTMMIVSIMA